MTMSVIVFRGTLWFTRVRLAIGVSKTERHGGGERRNVRRSSNASGLRMQTAWSMPTTSNTTLRGAPRAEVVEPIMEGSSKLPNVGHRAAEHRHRAVQPPSMESEAPFTWAPHRDQEERDGGHIVGLHDCLLGCGRDDVREWHCRAKCRRLRKIVDLSFHERSVYATRAMNSR